MSEKIVIPDVLKPEILPGTMLENLSKHPALENLLRRPALEHFRMIPAVRKAFSITRKEEENKLLERDFDSNVEIDGFDRKAHEAWRKSVLRSKLP